MVNWISRWTQSIVIAVIISTIIEIILPNSNIKKYVRTVIGVYIVFIIISPIVTKITGKEITLDSLKLPETKAYEKPELDTNAYVETTYIHTIKQDIIKNIEEKGYKVLNLEIEIERQEEKYGNINSINLQISKQKKKLGDIQPVVIDVNNQQKEDKGITNEEIQGLKEYLEKNYEAEKVFINEY